MSVDRGSICEAGEVLGRAAAEAWRWGELPVDPQEVRRVMRSITGLDRWYLVAGFVIGIEDAAEELAQAAS